MIGDTDLVVANSQYLSDYARKYNRHSYYVGQGCDLDHFLSEPIEKEIQEVWAGIQRPRVGYIGALNSERLDISLLIELAKR